MRPRGQRVAQVNLVHANIDPAPSRAIHERHEIAAVTV
jgi:hypothetical protein